MIFFSILRNSLQIFRNMHIDFCSIFKSPVTQYCVTHKCSNKQICIHDIFVFIITAAYSKKGGPAFMLSPFEMDKPRSIVCLKTSTCQ